MSSWRCFLKWPPGHRYEVAERDGVNVLRCTSCGEEKQRGKFRLPDGGNPVGGPPTDR